jgi:nicotinamidase-related amidase
MKNTALLVIDVQNDYFPNGHMALHQPEIALQHINQLEQHFRENQQPIIYIQHVQLDTTRSFFIKDTEGVDLHAGLDIHADSIIIEKHFPNSFFQTDLKQLLDRLNVGKLMITGMMTHMCVDATTRAAKELGYETTVVADATATRELVFEGQYIAAETVQQVLLATLQMLSKVVNTQEVLQMAEV